MAGARTGSETLGSGAAGDAETAGAGSIIGAGGADNRFDENASAGEEKATGRTGMGAEGTSEISI
jgi:hypothetical protein